jgi:hypothetical protein
MVSRANGMLVLEKTTREFFSNYRDFHTVISSVIADELFLILIQVLKILNLGDYILRNMAIFAPWKPPAVRQSGSRKT